MCLRISVGRTCLMAEQLPLPQLCCIFFCILRQYLLSCKRFLMILSFLWCAGDIMLSGGITVMSPETQCDNITLLQNVSGDMLLSMDTITRSDIIRNDDVFGEDKILSVWTPLRFPVIWSYIWYCYISHDHTYNILLYLTGPSILLYLATNIQHWWASNDCFLW